jgi:hypothetical protein
MCLSHKGRSFDQALTCGRPDYALHCVLREFIAVCRLVALHVDPMVEQTYGLSNLFERRAERLILINVELSKADALSRAKRTLDICMSFFTSNSSSKGCMSGCISFSAGLRPRSIGGSRFNMLMVRCLEMDKLIRGPEVRTSCNSGA